VKKFLVAAIAAAAFGSAPALAAAPIWNWTGFYIGAEAGGAWGHQDAAYCRGYACPTGFIPLNSHGVSGGFAGGEAGYRIQIDRWVLGVGGNFDWAHISGGTFCSNTNDFGPGATCHSNANRYATLTGQFGYTMGQALFYGKGGAAWLHQSYDLINPNNPPPCVGNSNCRNDGSETRLGWTLGTGVAYALDPKWSVLFEYDYMNFGTKAVHIQCTNTCFTAVITDFPMNVTQHIHAIKAGISYRFD
jgi:outer membrane immunogenic protein